MLETQHPARPSRDKMITAFAAIYLIWGSTYLAIHYAIETLPPLMMAGTRFLIAGAVLYGWARWRGAERPMRTHWREAGVIGALLLLLGNGGVVWSEQWVASGLAGLLIAAVPLWVVVLDWLRPGGVRPKGRIAVGLMLGLVAMVLLVGPGSLGAGTQVNLMGAAALALASLSWAAGSLYGRYARLPSSTLLASGMEMIAGGAFLLLAGIVTGEWVGFDWHAVSWRSVLAVAYLIVFGSLVGFTAYSWLLKATTPARLSTTAYANPVVALLLGWAVAGETLSGRILLAMTIIVAAVALITTHQESEAAREAEVQAHAGRRTTHATTN